MKKIVFLSVLLAAGTAQAAIDCAVLPSCDSLGYTDKVAYCPDQFLTCPFDNTKGLCILAARPGDVTYSLAAAGKGWLPCAGGSVSKEVYPDLYAVIGDNFGAAANNKLFKLPNYAGYFFRAKGGENTDMYTAQSDGLPNIYGYWYAEGMMRDIASPVSYGALYTYNVSSRSNWANGAMSYPLSKGIGFDASKYNSIYGASSYVRPRNYALNTYIYAGKRGVTGDLSKCKVGDFIHTDYSCASAPISSKTVLGYIINQESNSFLAVSGGDQTAKNFLEAQKACQSAGHMDILIPTLIPNYIAQMTAIPSGSSVVTKVTSDKIYVVIYPAGIQCSGTTSDTCKTVNNSTVSQYYYCSDTIYF